MGERVLSERKEVLLTCPKHLEIQGSPFGAMIANRTTGTRSKGRSGQVGLTKRVEVTKDIWLWVKIG